MPLLAQDRDVFITVQHSPVVIFNCTLVLDSQPQIGGLQILTLIRMWRGATPTHSPGTNNQGSVKEFFSALLNIRIWPINPYRIVPLPFTVLIDVSRYSLTVTEVRLGLVNSEQNKHPSTRQCINHQCASLFPSIPCCNCVAPKLKRPMR